MSKSNIVLSECKICGVTAFYSYYGVIACESCKMFFKRNAEDPKKKVICEYGGKCEINIHNRRKCPSCRLLKCFKVGMSTELIRSSHTNKKGKFSTSLISIEMNNQQSQKLATLNLLEQDKSLLNNDEWTLLSNLIHSYDEHNALLISKDFMKELDSLHPKLRFKIDSKRIIEVTRSFYDVTEPFIQSNHDFTSLPFHDRSIVLRGVVDNVSCLGGPFIMHQSGLITNSAFCNGLEQTYGYFPFNFTLNVISLLDQDINIVKLTLSIIAFCTSNCTVFNEDTSCIYITDIPSFLRIQNMYAEVLWKYLMYTCTFEQAVIRFMRLVQCIMTTLTVRTHLQTVRNHTNVIDSLIQKIEQQSISIDDI